jgi:hypothetical protein
MSKVRLETSPLRVIAQTDAANRQGADWEAAAEGAKL